MKFEEFEATARRMWSEIPEEYKEGIDGLVVRKEALEHPEHDDYFTLGMCFTEPYPGGYGGPESTRSILALYYGSFVGIAEDDPEFPWEDELWETITHELRHHLEYLVEDETLERVDYAAEQSHLRFEGLDFDPWYFQSGLQVAPGVYRVEGDVYVEQKWKPDAFLATGHIEFEWAGQRWSVRRPEELGDIHYVWIDGIEEIEGIGDSAGSLQLVLIRELTLWERAKRLRWSDPLDLLESEATAEPVK
jgi:predicted Zn-dependent protease with MMP-like domain